MSVYRKVTKEEKVNLVKFVEQQKIQRTSKPKIIIVKPTHDENLAKNLLPIIKK